MNWRGYSFIKESEYDSKLEAISSNFVRMDELDHAIEWGIAHNPDGLGEGFEALGDGYFLWKMAKISRLFPVLLIFYRVEDGAKKVTLLRVKEVEEEF